MQKIIQTIELEPFKTRYPLTYPALRNGYYSFVDNETLKSFTDGNYNTIPLGIDEEICGTKYENFTAKMGELYAGKVIDYITLKKWYNEFLDYYKLLYSNECHGPYSSATHYYNSIASNGMVNYYKYGQIDENFNEHGGENFYRWLVKYYFISLDFMNEYFIARDIDGITFSKTPKEWLVCVNNLPNNIMYYPDACEFFAKIKTWYNIFSEPNSITSENCCDAALYNDYGGNDLYFLLGNWVDKETKIISKINSLVNTKLEALTPKININIPLKKKVEDFGNFISFSKEFVLGKEYIPGNVCTYNDNVYLLMEGIGYITNPVTGLIEFDKDNWKPYYEYYKSLNPNEFVDFKNNFQLSGRTTSSLDSFERTTETVDNLGNVLEGYFEPSKLSNFMQPAENTLLNLKYEIGKAINTTYISDNVYSGDLLISIDFYYKDIDGNVLNETIVSCKEGDNILNAIDECQTKAISVENRMVDVVWADFTYYKGCDYTYEEDPLTHAYKSQLINKTINGKSFNLGVKCIDHCTLELQTASYYLSENESYPVRYYKVNKDIEEKYSTEYDTTVQVAMCDWYLEPAGYEFNGMVISPSIRKEELVGYTMPENLTDNIYIDRGYSTVLDKHLKIGEISSFEALEKYGNGSFNLINLEEESV